MYFFLATASHGLLDAMTDGGLGVAFFAPIDNRRYFFPWTPIRVSPIGIARFFTARGLAVIQTELIWIWLPTGLLAVAAWMIRRREFAKSEA
jgi:inner membrane protein